MEDGTGDGTWGKTQENHSRDYEHWKKTGKHLKYGLSGQRQYCFVATCVYGDINHPTVERLRVFRDTRLARHALGRYFVNIYYEHGQNIANWLEHRSKMKRLIRYLLDFFTARVLGP